MLEKVTTQFGMVITTSWVDDVIQRTEAAQEAAIKHLVKAGGSLAASLIADDLEISKKSTIVSSTAPSMHKKVCTTSRCLALPRSPLPSSVPRSSTEKAPWPTRSAKTKCAMLNNSDA